ncbi:MAG: aspartate aminotransferase family protein [Acidimicrobiales bacterium]|nr:aspartate aminotransferase family protein [Acidimicrobiales bacterium]MCB9396055.1 aspartate aminotransferase family protein [Acidimicrobiaceae bacterium]
MGIMLPHEGMPVDDVLDQLRAKRTRDVDWAAGRTFGMVYDGGPSVHEVAERTALEFLHENALNTKAFPSLGAVQSEVVRWTAGLFHGPDTASGFLTSGGTESILCAVLAARERGKAERGVTRPEMVIAESAHAAFHKAAHLFGVTVHKTKVRADWTADVDEMAAAVNDRTVLVVGSAPQYPQGVIDPIPAIAALAASVGASCHVDACMGGFVLPFAEMLGRDVPPWDFRVPGVTSISADVHKLGYAPKGVSVILYTSPELRAHQTFVFDDWLGGFYASPNLQGTRPGAPMAMGWAVMRHLGVEGYLRLTADALDTADRMRAAVASVDGIRVLGEGRYHLVAIAADDQAHHGPIDVFALGDALLAKGWFHDRQAPPESLHSTVSHGNAAVIDDWVAALEQSVAEVRGTRTDDRSTNYATLE